MLPITRRDFLGIAATGLGGLWLGEPWRARANPAPGAAAFEELHKRFQNPDRKYSIRPFWFWNGKLDGEELGRQIRQMVEHGVYGAYAHNRDGLETPYLSEAWWEAVGGALRAAREAGFSLCMVDEFEWPSGEARDYWLPGINKSRVVAANPAFRMRCLRAHETEAAGHQPLEIPLPPDTAAVVAGHLLGPGRFDGESLRTLDWDRSAPKLSWTAPEGKWLVTVYSLEETQSPDGGTVDLMSEEAVRKFIDIYYEEFYRRYKEYFGSNLVATFADHEGSYGGTIGWTPSLFEAFAKQKGYRLEAFLPALKYDIGARTEKVRCDYLDVVSELYSRNFFGQVNEWCRAHGLAYSGHVWEESLYFGPWVQGDFFHVLRAMGNPGCDTLVEWGRQSVWLKEVASVADFEGRRAVCENQGVQGSDSYLSPERMRRVSNCLGAWNIAEFIPHAFDYDLNRINFPPDWFRSQPFLSQFQSYADQMRRISFMNSESRHVADVLLYYPQVSIWGQSATAFRDPNFESILSDAAWTADASDTNSTYALLKLRLTEERFDYKCADDYYLGQSRVDGKLLRIGDSSSQILILPPMSTVRRATVERVRDFYEAGGTVIVLHRLSVNSVEDGRDDAKLKSLWEAMFDTAPTSASFTERTNAQGGRAYFVPGSVEDVVRLLPGLGDRDVEVVNGPKDQLYVLHKQNDGLDFYWIVNDTPSPRTNLLRLRALGRAERWDAATGKRLPVFYQTSGKHSLVRLSLEAWDAAYIVFDPAGPAQPLELKATNLDDVHILETRSDQLLVQGRRVVSAEPAFIELSQGGKVYRGEYKPAPAVPLEITGAWEVSVGEPAISLPYTQVRDDPEDLGVRGRWFAARPEESWAQLWLSPMNCSIREWNFVGPFPNPGDHGLEQSFPPEREIDYRSAYTGDAGSEIRWQSSDSAEEIMERPPGGWSLGTVVLGGGPFAPRANIVDYGKALRMDSPLSGTVFGQTNLHVREAQDAVVVLSTPNPAAAWMNGRQVYSRWLRPLYHELTDGFAFRIPVRLEAGWNSLLLKFLHNPVNAKAGVFTCRVDGAEGRPLRDLLVAVRRVPDGRLRRPEGFRWLRFSVPPVAGALRVPSLRARWLAFVDGKPATAGREIPLPRGTRVVALRVAAGEVLDQPFEFVATRASMPLGTWSVPGLEHFSGYMTYEKTLEVPGEFLKERLLLDCGEVGVVAEVWVNGAYAGARPWQPFVFDVTEHVRRGANRLKVRVANTAGNARATGTWVGDLKNIDLNGWIGPARLVPYFDREIRCA